VLVIARTVAHLFRQLRAQERPLAELELVRRAYDFGMPLHSGRFEVDGTPFHVHGLGVASIASQVGAPSAVVGAAVLHNAYNTGDWGDGRGPGPFDVRRERVRREVGPEVEALLTGLRASRGAHLVAGAMASGAVLDEPDRWYVLLDLCDFLDKWDDGRIAYGLPDRDDRRFVDAHQDEIVALAERLGWPELSAGLTSAFARLADDKVPPSLVPGRRYSQLLPPPSFRPSIGVEMMRRARRAKYAVGRWRAR
jgi:(p)ppGpp synthase/HD superfamily hydrolase